MQSSMTADRKGVGRSFGIQEVLDQIGAFAGPVLLYLVMLFQTDGTTFAVYSRCFAVLAIPGAITILLLLFTRMKFPNPERFEPEPKEYVPFKMKKEFVLDIAGISLFAFGFIDYSIIIMHVSRTPTRSLPPALPKRPRSSAAVLCRFCTPGRCSLTRSRRLFSA